MFFFNGLNGHDFGFKARHGSTNVPDAFFGVGYWKDVGVTTDFEKMFF